MSEKYIEPVSFTHFLDNLAAEWRSRQQYRPLLPSMCALCHGWGQQRVCDDCTRRFTLAVTRCNRCALQVPGAVNLCGACLHNPPPFAGTVAAVDYAYPWDGLITRFKFHGGLDLATALTLRLVQAHRDQALAQPELLLPVPLSQARLRERGYNQAWELTRRAGRAMRCAVDGTLLLRITDTPHQLDLPPDQRIGNVRGAFAVDTRRRGELAGRNVTVVDDVMTTGATAAEITRVLLRAGAAEVRIWVVARTPRPGTG